MIRPTYKKKSFVFIWLQRDKCHGKEVKQFVGTVVGITR